MTTHTLTRDRAYFRMCDDVTLIRLADDSRDELALVLAERLAEASQLEEECAELQCQLDGSTTLVDRLRDQIADLEEELDHLRDVIIAERRA